MRIVQISPYDLSRHGGVQQHVLSLAAELRKRGHEVLVIGPGRDADQVRDASGVDIITLGSKRKVSLLGTSFELSLASMDELKHLSARLADFRPDVMHYHTMWVPLLAWQIFRNNRYASVATFHDTPPPGPSGDILRMLFKGLSRYLLTRLDGAIAVSTAPLGHLRPGPRGCKPLILPPVTDLQDFYRVEKKVDAGRKTALYFGRLEPRKGISVLLKTWDLLASGAVPLPVGAEMPQLIVAGDGELEPLVKAAEQRLGQSCVQHVPSPDHEGLLELLSQASVVISPAVYGESFGIVLVEALASGTPVIGAANAGYVNVLTGPGEDLLVPPGDPVALARKISALLGDAARWGALQAWGREHARQFDVAAAAPAFERVYASALRDGRSKLDGSGSR